jgi:hypothetical protein
MSANSIALSNPLTSISILVTETDNVFDLGSNNSTVNENISSVRAATSCSLNSRQLKFSENPLKKFSTHVE